jgi:hypothetical protein
MNEQKFIQPIAGVLIRDPVTMIHLKPEGEYKPWIAYWRGVVREGSAKAFDTMPVEASNKKESEE